MWPLFALAVLLAALGLAGTSARVQRPAADELASDAVAINLLVYDRAAAVFSTENSGFEGEVTPAMVGDLLPSGYSNLGTWRSYVMARHMITVPTSVTRFAPDVADALARHTDGQLLVGRMSSRDEAYAGPLTCWGFVSPQASCVPGTVYPALLTAYAARGVPIVLRKLNS